LNGFQLVNGGFSYWQGNNTPDDWSTSYVGHFMLEAEKKGYVLPLVFKQKWIQYQQQAAKQWRFANTYRNDIAQAYRLYTLALAGKADMSSMNRLRETVGISNEAKIRLAACYALAGQKTIGQNMLNLSQIVSKEKTNHYFGSLERNQAMALETLILLGQKGKALQMAEKIAKSLASNEWMSTQTTAYCLVAMSKFGVQNNPKGMQIILTTKGKSQDLNTNKSIIQQKLALSNGQNQITVQNKESNALFVRILTSGVLPVGQEKAMQSKINASVIYKSRNNQILDVSKITQSTTFYAEITLKNETSESVENIALTQILPSGFEIVNARYTDFGGESQNKADHIDIRDDRSNFYFSMKPQEVKVFKVVINASYLGTYYLPGLQAEAMYDHTFVARTKGQWIEIVK